MPTHGSRRHKVSHSLDNMHALHREVAAVSRLNAMLLSAAQLVLMDTAPRLFSGLPRRAGCRSMLHCAAPISLVPGGTAIHNTYRVHNI